MRSLRNWADCIEWVQSLSIKHNQCFLFLIMTESTVFITWIMNLIALSRNEASIIHLPIHYILFLLVVNSLHHNRIGKCHLRFWVYDFVLKKSHIVYHGSIVRINSRDFMPDECGVFKKRNLVYIFWYHEYIIIDYKCSDRLSVNKKARRVLAAAVAEAWARREKGILGLRRRSNLDCDLTIWSKLSKYKRTVFCLLDISLKAKYIKIFPFPLTS